MQEALRLLGHVSHLLDYQGGFGAITEVQGIEMIASILWWPSLSSSAFYIDWIVLHVLYYVQHPTAFVFRFSYVLHASSTRVPPILRRNSSQAMQICKVSARDMIGEENLKQTNNF